MVEKGRKSLVWDIRTSLYTLLPGQLYQVANNVGPAAGQEQPQFEFEDTGMVQLLMLKDLIDNLIANEKCRRVITGRVQIHT